MQDGFRLVATGQALIERLPDVRERAQLEAIARLLGGADIAFCNLEAALRTQAPSWPTKERTLHTAPPEVLDVLRALNITAVSLANNHVADLGPLNLLETIREVTARDLLHAGAGADATEAARVRQRGRFALLAVSAGPAPIPGRALNATEALPARPGVNGLAVTRRVTASEDDLVAVTRLLEASGQLRRVERERGSGRAPAGAEGSVDFYGTPVAAGDATREDAEADHAEVSRLLSSVGEAAAAGARPLVSIHYHDWEPDWASPPSWLVELAHEAIDHGAFAVIAHGPPVPSGIEVYRDALIAYGMGNLVFHTHRHGGYPQPEVWCSPLLDAVFDSQLRLLEARVHALVLERDAGGVPGFPHLATPEEAAETLALIARLSTPFGTTLSPQADGSGLLR